MPPHNCHLRAVPRCITRPVERAGLKRVSEGATSHHFIPSPQARKAARGEARDGDAADAGAEKISTLLKLCRMEGAK